MWTTKPICNNKKCIAIIIWIFINSIFVFKYSYRLSLLIAIACTAFYIGILCQGFWRYNKKPISISNKIWYLFLFSITIISIFIFKIIPVETIRVDRWEMIQIFWDSVYNGIYPYSVHSLGGNYPGPMPVYFLIAYPFYLIQEIGWLGVIALWLLFLFVKNKHLPQVKQTYIMLFVILSVFVYYEIITRSTILLNSMIFIFYYIGLKDMHKFSNIKFYGYALLGGVILSTRNVFAIPMILWGMKTLLSKQMAFWKFFKWFICFLFSFTLTFSPFFISDFTLFLQYNPFITQGGALLPFTFIIPFITLSFILPCLFKEKTDVSFLSIILLFSVVSCHVFYAIYNLGFDAYLFAGADISYYIFCIPFIFELLTRKDDDQ